MSVTIPLRRHCGEGDCCSINPKTGQCHGGCDRFIVVHWEPA